VVGMKISGWKNISMIDVKGAVTFTLWLCGCNLRCPFCHNWRIADGLDCKDLDKDAFLMELVLSKKYIDYLHVTGGEPLLQWRELIDLFKDVKNLNIRISLNSNLTLTKPLKNILNKELIDHIATDLKAPPEKLYGVSSWNKFWASFLDSLEIISEYNIPLELRIPVIKGFSGWERHFNEAFNVLKYDNFYIILNPILGPPITDPRDREWCIKYCNPSKNDINKVKSFIEKLGISKIFIAYQSTISL